MKGQFRKGFRQSTKDGLFDIQVVRLGNGQKIVYKKSVLPANPTPKKEKNND